MKVDVLIERDRLGRLHAYVTHRRVEGTLLKGDDMLRRRVIRDVDMAKIECDRAIRGMFVLVDLDEINYTLPEDWKP